MILTQALPQDETAARIVRLTRLFAAHHDRELTTVSRWATGSGDTFGRLLDNKDITTSRAAKVLQWFSANWPVDLPWPADIPRPPATPPE